MLSLWVLLFSVIGGIQGHDSPFSKIAVENTNVILHPEVAVTGIPTVIHKDGRHVDYVTVKFNRLQQDASADDWIGVFSPADYDWEVCKGDLDSAPRICTAPIKFQYCNFSSPNYLKTGIGSLKFRLIKQRGDFAFGYFTGGFVNPRLIAKSNIVTSETPKAPVYPRLAQGDKCNEMSVTWTSGYGLQEAMPFVRWFEHGKVFETPASTLTFTQRDMCGSPANTVGWRDPGYIHSAFLKDLWPNTKYFYTVGHRFRNGTEMLGTPNYFKSSPAVGEESLQRVIIFGDMGKQERDLSNEYNNYQPAALNTTDRLREDLVNIDIVFHIGDIAYANGYLSQWDQFTEQVEDIAGRVPYMLASGNHERDFPASGSFYNNMDSGGECGVPVQTMFSMPLQHADNYWYGTNYGMFHFCIADTEKDWREGTEQYKFLEQCFANVNRQRQPWLIFIAHRVMGYSSASSYADKGISGEPMGKDLEKLLMKYKVDLAFYGHVHNYERTCPIYQSRCISNDHDLSGPYQGPIHTVAGGGGAAISSFAAHQPNWSLFRDADFGFVKLTAANRNLLTVEYKRSSDGLKMGERQRPNILVTGTPGTGKTSFSSRLADSTGLHHLNVGEIVKEKKLHDGWDPELECYILDEDLLLDDLEDTMKEGGNIVDYHSCSFFPERWFDAVIVLQTDNSILYDRLSSRGYSGEKLQNNIQCEIFQVLVEEAYEGYSREIVKALPSNTIEDMSNNVETVKAWLQSRNY